MSAPLISGAIALMKTQDPDIQNTTLFAKLIYSANNGILDIANALEYELGESDLHFVSFTLEDSLGDNDGRADAGETIQIWLTVNNTAGLADSVQAILRFGEFEDTTTSEIIDSVAYIGYISTFASLNNQTNPLLVQISDEIANNRDIVFEYEVFPLNGPAITGNITITAFNTVELGDFFTTDTTLTADFEYWMTENLRVMPGCTLTINPGVHIVIMPEKTLDIDGVLIVNGTPDSLVDISSNGSGSRIIFNTLSSAELNYTYFHDFLAPFSYYFIKIWLAPNVNFNDVIFSNCFFSVYIVLDPSVTVNFNRVNIINCNGIWAANFCHAYLFNCNVNNNFASEPQGAIYNFLNSHSSVYETCLFNNIGYSISTLSSGGLISFLTDNFWGTTDTTIIHEEEIYDF